MRPRDKQFKTYAQERITMTLLDLMAKDDFIDITIQEIAQKAGVSRRTFYLHYKSKIDVLDRYYDVLASKYYASIPANARGDYRTQALLFFSFWKQHSSYLETLYRNGMMYVLLQKLEEYLDEMIVANTLEGGGRYYSSFFAGGLWALLLSWVRSDFVDSPAELAEVASKFEALDAFCRFPSGVTWHHEDANPGCDATIEWE